MYNTLKGKRGGHPTLTCRGCLYTSNISEPRCRDILPSDHFTIRALDSLTALPSLSNTVRHRIVFSTFSLSLEITSSTSGIAYNFRHLFACNQHNHIKYNSLCHLGHYYKSIQTTIIKFGSVFRHYVRKYKHTQTAKL